MNRPQYNNNYSFYNNRLRCLQLLTNVTKDMVYLENSLIKENITPYEHNNITSMIVLIVSIIIMIILIIRWA